MTFSARGGISRVHAFEGGPPVDSVLRYGSHLELFFNFKRLFEIGGYHATWFEPPIAGDPWGAPRRWTTEAGVMLRLRTGMAEERAPVRRPSGDAAL